METYSPNKITGKYYRIHGGKGSGNGVCVSTEKTYCIDYNQATWNISGIWEDGEECLKMYSHCPEKNRIGGLNGLVMNASCWDVLDEIYRSEHDKKSGIEKHWFFRKSIK